LREQAIINGLVCRDRYTRLSGKTHHGAIPGFELGRLAVDNVSFRPECENACLQRNPRVGEGPVSTCAVIRRRFFQWVQGPPGDSLQPEATGAGMKVTKCLKPPDSGHEIGDRASVQAAT